MTEAKKLLDDMVARQMRLAEAAIKDSIRHAAIFGTETIKYTWPADGKTIDGECRALDAPQLPKPD